MNDAEAVASGHVYRIARGATVAYAKTADEANECAKALKDAEGCPEIELLRAPQATNELVTMILACTAQEKPRRLLGAYLEGVYALRQVEHELLSLSADENWIAAARSRTDDYIRNALRHLTAVMADQKI